MRMNRALIAGTCTAALLFSGMSAVTNAAEPAATAGPAATLSASNVGAPPCNVKPKTKGKKPGQLLSYAELPVDPALLTGARMFRVLYTTMGVDEKTVEASCGLVVMPAGNLANEIVAWAHGTVGVTQKCQPSNDPSKFLSNGAIKYGDGINAVNGSPLNGIFQGLVDQGRMITATDYYSGIGGKKKAEQNYALGTPAGAAVLDSARIGIQLADKVAGVQKDRWQVVPWGASQGGHAAMWAGQIAQDYLKRTKLSGQPDISVVGVGAVVPASSFVATKKGPKSLVGRHLADLEMHESMMTIPPNNQLGASGPILFSLVMTAWSNFPGTGKLTKKSAFPGYPYGVKPQMNQVLTKQGVATAKTVSSGCANEAGLLPIMQATQGYLVDPKTNRFFVNPIWGKPDKQGVWHGKLDKTCLNKSTKKGVKDWCQWMAYNMPGPAGINPFNKMPKTSNGSLAPVLIAQGMDDRLIYCQNSSPTVPSPKDCMSRQLYDAMAGKQSCSATSIDLDLIAKTDSSPATHFSTYAQIADNGQAAYSGSRMDDFVNDAFDGKVGTGCQAKVVNQ